MYTDQQIAQALRQFPVLQSRDESGKPQARLVVLHDGLLFGSEWYELE